MSTLTAGIALSSGAFSSSGVLLLKHSLLTAKQANEISIALTTKIVKSVDAITVSTGTLKRNKVRLNSVAIGSLGVTSSVNSSNSIVVSCNLVSAFGEVLTIPNLPLIKGTLNEKEVPLTGKAATFDLNFQVGTVGSAGTLTYYLKGYNSASTSYEYWSTLGYPSLIGKEYLTGVSIVGTN